MPVWYISSDPKSNAFQHRFAAGQGHALLSHIARGAFHLLRVSASIWVEGYWWLLHEAPTVTTFESEHGVETERQAYNERMLAAVQRERAAKRGEHSGYSDWYVPIIIQRQVAAILVVGPLLLERPTSAVILDRWQRLSGRKGALSDPEFALYLKRSLSTLVLEGRLATNFAELLGCFAELLAGSGQADELANRADALRVTLENVRQPERTWDVAQAMIDERSPRAWAGMHSAYALASLGLSRLPDHVAVGLGAAPDRGRTASRSAPSDPVDEAVRRDAFQRKVVQLARSAGDALAGRLEERGIVLFSTSTGSRARKQQKLLDLIERARVVARREFDLALHFGLSAAPSAVSLNRSYQRAFAAAESALSRGERLVSAEAEVGAAPDLGALRRELGRVLGERPGVLRARFDRYLEAVLVRSGDRVEAARAHLEAGFERMTEAFVDAGSLDQKSLSLLSAALERATTGADQVHDLLAAYRQGAADLSDAVERPVQSRQDRSLRGALDHIQQHYTERLSFQQVARVSGFAPKYFSVLFKERQHQTFEAYVLGLRLERSKHLLSSTDFKVARVAQLSGFGSFPYFCRVFRREVGKSPLEFRALRLYPEERAKRRLAKTRR